MRGRRVWWRGGSGSLPPATFLQAGPQLAQHAPGPWRSRPSTRVRTCGGRWRASLSGGEGRARTRRQPPRTRRHAADSPLHRHASCLVAFGARRVARRAAVCAAAVARRRRVPRRLLLAPRPACGTAGRRVRRVSVRYCARRRVSHGRRRAVGRWIRGGVNDRHALGRRRAGRRRGSGWRRRRCCRCCRIGICCRRCWRPCWRCSRGFQARSCHRRGAHAFFLGFVVLVAAQACLISQQTARIGWLGKRVAAPPHWGGCCGRLLQGCWRACKRPGSDSNDCRGDQDTRASGELQPVVTCVPASRQRPAAAGAARRRRRNVDVVNARRNSVR